MFPQAELETRPDECNVPYSNSLFVDPHEPGYLSKTTGERLFHCGEIVTIKRNPNQRVIVMDWKFDGKQYWYRIEAVK